MPWGELPAGQIRFLPAYLTACRYAIKPLVYSLFEDVDDFDGRLARGGFRSVASTNAGVLRETVRLKGGRFQI
jgi:hypothetical protein